MEGEVKPSKHVSEKKQKHSADSNQPKQENKMENKEIKNEVKTETANAPKEKSAPAKVTKKDQASVNAQSLPVSKKHLMYICAFVKNKSIDQSISQLEEVLKFKRAIPMKGEIPHRSHPGMMSGRYPIKATKAFIQLLKGLKGNAIVNQMDLEKTRIVLGSPSWASRPMRRGGMKFKRTNLILIAKEIQDNKTKENKK